MSLSSMLESFGLEDDWIVVQPDTMELECVHCGDRVTADVVDLHTCEGSR